MRGRQILRDAPTTGRRAAAGAGRCATCASRSTPSCASATYDYERKQYNTVVSGAMKMLNALDAAAARTAAGGGIGGRDAAVLRECTSILLRSLYPVVPHIAHALWQELGFGRAARRLDRDHRRAVAAGGRGGAGPRTQELVLQVNGKVRGTLQLPADADTAADRGARGRGARSAAAGRRQARPGASSSCPAGS